MKIVLSSYAEFKLGTLISYLKRKWNAELAKKYLEEIDATLLLIADFPEMFPTYEEDTKIRKAVISKHNSVLYEIKEDIIFVLTFSDNRQGKETVMKELKKYLN